MCRFLGVSTIRFAQTHTTNGLQNLSTVVRFASSSSAVSICPNVSLGYLFLWCNGYYYPGDYIVINSILDCHLT